MQHHKHHGRAPSHGFKVGIGTLASTAFYERLLERPLSEINIDACCANWPPKEQWLAEARRLFPEKELLTVTLAEISAKMPDTKTLRGQLTKLRSAWPDLRERLRTQLLPFGELRQMLQDAGAPVEPEQIGIPRRRLRDSFRQALFLRRRFTVLDVAARVGMFDSCVAEIFGADGPWPLSD
jgi:glycerol-1-phosphate dehydrogenase [NAD(P)+]